MQTIDELLNLANKGDLDAQGELAVRYIDGIGISKDEAKGRELLEKAANSGHARSQYNIGRCYLFGLWGSIKNERKGIDYLERSTGQRTTTAETLLGICYFDGIGVAVDRKKAVDLYQRAADKGDAEGQGLLGNAYKMVQNYDEAFKWFEKAAEQNVPASAAPQYQLGLCYAAGTGVAHDIDKARYWIKKAADNGNPEAKEACIAMQNARNAG